MELEMTRKVRTQVSTISELKVNGVFECFVLEDKDRGLSKDMPLSEMMALKVHGKTAIPTGRYEIVISYSNRFQKYLPELRDVPGYAGIRIHPGNTAADTEGCLLPGQTKAKDMVGSSRVAFNALFTKLKAVERKEKIFITIK